MVFNEVDRGLELSSSSSSSTTNNIIDTIINHHEHSLSSSSGDSLSSYCYPSFSAYFSEEPIGDDINLQPKKRRKRNRPRAHPFPRIVKTDIRRTLHRMYCNTVNSGDTTLFQQFLSEFCVGSCCLMKNLDDRGMYRPSSDKLLTIRGLNNVTNFLTNRIFSFPDIVTRIEKSWIRHQLDTPGSAVVAKVNIRSTVLKEHPVDASQAVYRLPSFIADALGITGDEQYVPGGIASRYDLLLEAYSIFHLDNDNRIYRLEFHGRLQALAVSI